MGFISKGSKPKEQHSGTTVIASGTKLRGELILESALHIDGSIEGTIRSSGDVSVGESGSFEGTIYASHLVVSGYVNGKIECDKLEVITKGKVFGEITSGEFVIEPGGQFVGESHVKGGDPLPRLQQHHIPEDTARTESPPTSEIATEL